MKKILLASVFVAVLLCFCGAEPIALFQAGNAVAKGKLEAGADLNYAYDKYSFAINPAVTYTSYNAQPALSLKYGLDDSMELSVWAPYTLWTLSATGAVDTSASGLGQITGALKYSADAGSGMKAGFLLTVDVPTDSKKQLSEGLNLGIVALLKVPLDPLILDVNAGYELTFEYVNSVDSKINSGDNVSFGGALELLSGPFTYLLELNGVSFGNYSVDGAGQSGTAGLTLDVVPGIRFTSGNLKLKAGFAYAIGDPTFTKYQWKLLSGIAVVI